MVLPLILGAVAFGTIFAGYFAYRGGTLIADEVILPTINLSTGIVNTGFSFLASPFIDFFNAILNWVLVPIIVLVFTIAFFVIQYYLIKCYAWIFMKFYQIYLVVSQEDVAHFFQHPSVSYANLRKKYEPVTQTTPEVQVDNNVQTQTNTN